MATNNILGIDFGSTNSAFAVIEDDSPEIIANGERNPTTPSVIAFTDEGKPVVGEPAETLRRRTKRKPFDQLNAIWGNLIIRLCSFGTRRLISRISHAPSEVVDGRFQQHLTELQPPATRTHGSAERALD
jgi:hypothetical protein